MSVLGEVKWLKTVYAKWRIERVAGESGGRRWEVTRWFEDEDGVDQFVVFGRWVTWGQTIEAIMRQEEQWAERQEKAKEGEAERQERDRVWLAQLARGAVGGEEVEIVVDEQDQRWVHGVDEAEDFEWASDAWERDQER